MVRFLTRYVIFIALRQILCKGKNKYVTNYNKHNSLMPRQNRCQDMVLDFQVQFRIRLYLMCAIDNKPLETELK